MKHRLSQGFNIIELMIVLAIVGILVAAAAPSFRATIINNRIAGYASTLYQNIQQARSGARSLRSNSFILAESGTDAINPGLASNWIKGWRVTVTNNGALTLDSSQSNTQTGESNQNVSISVKNGGTPLNQFGFNRFGQLIDRGGAILPGLTIYVCSNTSTSENFKKITIDSTGNMKITSKLATDVDINC
jgi:type IV fimbrial biogenesis protein FimT